MKTLIICFSYHHKNTEKIAFVLGGPLQADIKSVRDVDLTSLCEYDLIGFGSGIYFSKHHKTLLEFANKLPQVTDKKAFIFSTSGLSGNASIFHKTLREKVESKGFQIVGEFNCAGFDTFGPFRLVGGIQKGHPNQEDLKQAISFALSLR
jgi:flavodoxin